MTGYAAPADCEACTASKLSHRTQRPFRLMSNSMSLGLLIPIREIIQEYGCRLCWFVKRQNRTLSHNIGLLYT